MDKRAEGIEDIDFGNFKAPMIAVYKKPDDYPDTCVARVFDLDKPTDTVIIRKTVEEMQQHLKGNGFVFMPRGKEDVLSLVGVWM